MKNTVGLSLPEYSFNNSHKALIVGAGLAGCAIAKALAQRGYRCVLFDQHTSLAAGASALPAAVIRPAISGDAFYSNYFNHAFDLCCSTFTETLFNQCGALELTQDSSCNHIESNSNKHITDFLSAGQASDVAGTELNNSALHIRNAGVVVPRQVCAEWIQHPSIVFQPGTRVSKLNKTEYGWQLISEKQTIIDESQLIILATAAATTQFNVTSEMPLQHVTGQIDRFEYSGPALRCVINSRGYLAPDTHGNADRNAQGVWCGATHHREVKNISVTDVDSAANRSTAATIAPQLATDAIPTTRFAEARTFTPDRLPVAGAAPDVNRYRLDYADLKHGKPPDSFPPPAFHHGVYLAAGLGSRGATQALLVGEMLAGLVAGNLIANNHSTPLNDSNHSLNQDFYQRLHPARFLLRALRRGA